MDNVRSLLHEQRKNLHPGTVLGICLASMSNDSEFLVCQLRAYLKAAEADLKAEKDFEAAMDAMLQHAEEESE